MRRARHFAMLVVAVALVGPALAAGEIAIVFVDPPAPPAADIPREARSAGTEPDPDAGGSSNITFRIVRDPSDHGPFAKLVAGRVDRLEVTWTDVNLFASRDRAADFLRRLLTLPRGSTHTHVFWAQAQPVPTFVATVRHAQGDAGSWHVWYAWPSIYAVYRDAAGTWWFSHWMNVEPLKAGSRAD